MRLETPSEVRHQIAVDALPVALAAILGRTREERLAAMKSTPHAAGAGPPSMAPLARRQLALALVE